ncbi:MAG: DegT/DnrJ/EryC1/StrS family aminotransferase [Pseudomonadales bacterium]
MKPDFLPPLADARDFPLPEVEMLPTKPSAASGSKRPSPAESRAVEYMVSARGLLSAIAWHFKSAKVLLPAYHCPALVEPFIYHQCNIEFYRVSEQLEFDEAELEEKLPTADLVVGIRYFGFECAMARLKQLAQQAKTLMVEDWAHAAFASELHGDFAVTSLKKFYPVTGGGELFIANPDWVEKMNRSVRQLRQSPANLLAQKIKARLLPRASQSDFRYFSPVASHAVVSASDRNRLNHYDHRQSAQRRRDHYQRLLEQLQGLGFARPLFAELQEGVVPYVFPLLLKDEGLFSLIRKKGIPLYRWEEVMATHCPVSMQYRRLLVQLPCHQDLTTEDIDFIVQAMWEIDQKWEHGRP